MEPLERLRQQRSRLADRMRLPWWYQTCAAILWALVFAGPFNSRYFPRAFPHWPVFAAAAAVALLMQWGLTRATGIKLRRGSPNRGPPTPPRQHLTILSALRC
jgi:hypothetical protein